MFFLCDRCKITFEFRGLYVSPHVHFVLSQRSKEIVFRKGFDLEIKFARFYFRRRALRVRRQNMPWKWKRQTECGKLLLCRKQPNYPEIAEVVFNTKCDISTRLVMFVQSNFSSNLLIC